MVIHFTMILQIRSYPQRQPRSFEIVHSDGTWYYGGTDQALGGLCL